jgi:hypothetical protein
MDKSIFNNTRAQALENVRRAQQTRLEVRKHHETLVARASGRKRRAVSDAKRAVTKQKKYLNDWVHMHKRLHHKKKGKTKDKAPSKALLHVKKQIEREAAKHARPKPSRKEPPRCLGCFADHSPTAVYIPCGHSYKFCRKCKDNASQWDNLCPTCKQNGTTMRVYGFY